MDEEGNPYAILPASRLVKLLVPDYVLQGPPLVAVVDEKHVDQLCRSLFGRPVRDALPTERQVLSVAAPDDTALEVATLMARERSPLVAVVERDRAGTRLLGVITAAHLLERLLGAV